MARTRIGREVAVAYVGARCEPRYKKWVERIADREGRPASEVVRDALARYAAAEGHPTPPSKPARRRAAPPPPA